MPSFLARGKKDTPDDGGSKDKPRSDKTHLSSTIEILLIIAISLVLGLYAAGFEFGTASSVQRTYDFTYQNSSDGRYLIVMAFRDNHPLQNVTVSLKEHGLDRLLVGPMVTDQSGKCTLLIPQGYSDYFDIETNYKGETITKTYDTRPKEAPSNDFWQTFEAPIIVGIILIILGIPAAIFANNYRKKGKST